MRMMMWNRSPMPYAATAAVPHRVVSQSDAAGITSALKVLADTVESGSSIAAAESAAAFTRAHLAKVLAAELDAIVASGRR